MPSRRSRPVGGVFCLEVGEWWGKLTDRDSVEHLLRLLESLGEFEYARRDVGTRGEFDYYLSEWAKPAHRKFGVLYLAFHGSQGSLELGNGDGNRDSVSLGDLGDVLENKLKGRVVHLGACSVMEAPTSELDRFLQKTGARAISGYRHEIGWVQSAAFDLILLDQLRRGEPYASRFAAARKSGGSVARELGFRARTSRDATAPRK